MERLGQEGDKKNGLLVKGNLIEHNYLQLSTYDDLHDIRPVTIPPGGREQTHESHKTHKAILPEIPTRTMSEENNGQGCDFLVVCLPACLSHQSPVINPNNLQQPGHGQNESLHWSIDALSI